MALDTTNSLVTLADTKAWCRVASGDTDYDDILENFIDEMSWAFNEYCGRKIKSRAHTGDSSEIGNGDGTSIYVVRHPPITDLSKIYVDSEHEFGADTEETEYQYNADSGIIYLEEDSFPEGFNTVKIEYTGGYTTIPYDMQVAIKDEVKRRFDRWKKNAESVNSMTFQNGMDVSFIRFDNLLTTTKSILDKYQILDHSGVRFG